MKAQGTAPAPCRPRAGEDRRQRLAPALVGALVEVEDEVPRRARLVVVVDEREHHGEAGEVHLPSAPALHRPRQGALAHAVRSNPRPARRQRAGTADREAVAGLEVRAGDRPGRVLAHRAERTAGDRRIQSRPCAWSSCRRYPVESLQGEQLDSVDVTGDGLEGDRRFAIYDLETGFGLTARRVPELLFASARLRDDGGVDITLPDGCDGARRRRAVGLARTAVALRSADADAPRRYENPEVDFEREAEHDWAPFLGASGAFHDSARVRVSLVSTGTLGSWTAAGSAPTCCSTARARTRSSGRR